MNFDLVDVVTEMTDESGYVVIPDAFDPTPMLPVLERLVEAHVATGAPTVDGGHRPDVLSLPQFQELMLKKEILEVGEGMVGGQVGFGSLTPNVVPAGSPGMGAHVDYPYSVMGNPPGALPVLCLQMIWYLVDVTEDLAPTAVVPGSQLRASKPDPDLFWNEAVPVLVKAGSLFMSHGGLWHATMPNRTDRPRPAVIAKYFPARSRPRWNPFVSIPQELLPGMVDLFYPEFKDGRRPGR